MSPGRPFLARNATRRSPSSFTRLTRPPAATSLDSTTGIQYWRRSAPIGVAGPVRVRSSLSSLLSIGLSLPLDRSPFHWIARLGRRGPGSVRPSVHRHVAVHALDVQREPLLVVAPFLVLRQLDELLGLVERLALADVPEHLAPQVLQIVAEHRDVSLAAERAMARGQHVEVHRLHLPERLDPVVDVAVGEIAEGEALDRDEVHGEEDSLL